MTLGEAVYCEQPTAPVSFNLEIIASLSADGSSPRLILRPKIRVVAIPETIPDSYGPATSQIATAQISGSAFSSTSTSYYVLARVIDSSFGSTTSCYLMKTDVVLEFLPGATVRSGMSP